MCTALTPPPRARETGCIRRARALLSRFSSQSVIHAEAGSRRLDDADAPLLGSIDYCPLLAILAYELRDEGASVAALMLVMRTGAAEIEHTLSNLYRRGLVVPDTRVDREINRDRWVLKSVGREAVVAYLQATPDPALATDRPSRLTHE